jgi:hypothetical protein
MTLARARFALVLAAFLGWLGYLGYLVADRPKPDAVILSRPQIFVSDLDVMAEIHQGSDVAHIVRVLYASDEADQNLAGKDIHLENLEDCRILYEISNKEEKWSDGEYLLPLQNVDSAGKERRVVIPPPSPGFATRTPRVYPATKDVLAQYGQIRKK